MTGCTKGGPTGRESSPNTTASDPMARSSPAAILQLARCAGAEKTTDVRAAPDGPPRWRWYALPVQDGADVHRTLAFAVQREYPSENLTRTQHGTSSAPPGGHDRGRDVSTARRKASSSRRTFDARSACDLS
jgi:hypothetical protein